MKPKIIIEIKKGMIYSFLSNVDVEYRIVDWDTDSSSKSISGIYSPDTIFDNHDIDFNEKTSVGNYFDTKT